MDSGARPPEPVPAAARTFRGSVLAFLLFSALAPSAAWAQEAVSPLPPPVTRSLYRSRWFEFLNAHLEDDAKTAGAMLADMKKTARAVGVHRLSDFSRTALHEARKAEALGLQDRARRAYAAAIELDDANLDAQISRLGYLVRRHSYGEAVRTVPDAAAALLETRELRLALLSAAAFFGAMALGATVIAFALVLIVRHSPRILHNLSEFADRRWGARCALPLGLVLLALPFAFGLGPYWAGLCWSALVYPYASKKERWILGVSLVLLGALPPLLAVVARENIIDRSPLYVAAVDLDEQREDGSAEDGLRQASAVFSEDPDVWFLLGMYAERSGDSERALESYQRAIQADPRDYRPFLNRGNVHFQEGDFAEAIRDYDAASQRSPRATEAYYNLSIARGEAYDFVGQASAMAKAREISERQIRGWTEHPTLARVVSVSYSLARARRKVEDWNGQPKSRRLPGHAAPIRLQDILFSPFTLGPWVVLALGLLFAGALDSREVQAAECVKCEKPFCSWCKRPGDPALYCSDCVRLSLRKEPVGIEAHVAQAREVRWRTRRRQWGQRLASLFLPGAHLGLSQRPLASFVFLFVFLLLAVVAAIHDRFYDLRPFPPPHTWHLATVVPLGLAGLLWLWAQRSAWKDSHGS